MLCNRCQKNEATVVIAGNLNGSNTTLHLCANCANAINEQLLQVFPGHSVDALFAQLSSHLPGIEEGMGTEDVFEETCPSCGYVLKNVQAPQLLGCADCYAAFAERLKPLLARLHRGVCHPPIAADLDKLAGTADQNKGRRQLAEKLQSAIENEEYEEAAMLRDVIKGINGNDGNQ